MPLYGDKTGFRNLRDLLLFTIGAGGVIWTMVTGSKGNINIATLTTFAGLLASPYILHTDERKPPSEEPERDPEPVYPARRPPAKRSPAKKAPAKKATKKAPAKKSTRGR